MILKLTMPNGGDKIYVNLAHVHVFYRASDEERGTHIEMDGDDGFDVEESLEEIWKMIGEKENEKD